jgi:hypothetical protein
MHVRMDMSKTQHRKKFRLLFCRKYLFFIAVFKRYVASPPPGTFFYSWAGVKSFSFINTPFFIFVSSIPLGFSYNLKMDDASSYEIFVSIELHDPTFENGYNFEGVK